LQEIFTKLSILKRTWSQNPAALEALNAIQRSIFQPLVKDVGFDYPDGEDYLQTMKRNLVIQACAQAKEKHVLEELESRFRKYQNGQKDAFHPNLRSTVFKSVLLYTETPEVDFNSILEIYLHGATVDERMAALDSLGAINDLSLVQRLLGIALDPNIVKPQDMRTPLLSLGGSPFSQEVPDLLWKWLQTHWDLLHETLSAGLNLLGSVVQACLYLNTRSDFVAEVEGWMAGEGLSADQQSVRRKQVKDAQRSFEQALESIKSNSLWYGRDNATVTQWLSKKVQK
jgi:aminopeptidase 2